MRRFVSAMLAVLVFAPFTLAPFVLSGCGKSDAPVAPIVAPSAPPGEMIVVSIEYIGNETKEDVFRSFDELATQGIILSSDERAHVLATYDSLQALPSKRRSTQVPAQPLATYGAYTSHYVTRSDTDLWLEYKWSTGSRQSYHMGARSLAMYTMLQACYGGSIVSWSWMEGSYQRVTAVVGTCIYYVFPDWYTRSYLVVVT